MVLNSFQVLEKFKRFIMQYLGNLKFKIWVAKFLVMCNQFIKNSEG